MKYISDDIDNKIKSLKGRFSYTDLLRETRDLLFGYTKDESLNFIRQSIYRLKRDGEIGVVKRGLFEINTGYIQKEKIKLSTLMKQHEVSRDTDEMALEAGLTNQIIHKKTYIVSESYRNKLNNDMGSSIKYTRYVLGENMLKNFEMARLSLFFDLNITSDINTFVRLLKERDYMDGNKVQKLAKYLHPRYKKQIDNLSKKIEIFKQQGIDEWT